MEKWTPEQLNKQASRIQSDSELLKKGAEFVVDEGAKDPRLEVTEEQVGEKHKEMEEQQRVDRINRYFVFMQNRVLDLENAQDDESAKLLKSRIASDREHIQDATFENNEWKVVFSDGSMQKIAHMMYVELAEKERDNENKELSKKWPETMAYIIELESYNGCMDCQGHGEPNTRSYIWNRLIPLIQKEVGINAEQLTEGLRALRELGWGSCSINGPTGVREVLKRRI